MNWIDKPTGPGWWWVSAVDNSFFPRDGRPTMVQVEQEPRGPHPDEPVVLRAWICEERDDDYYYLESGNHYVWRNAKWMQAIEPAIPERTEG
jgi:hypothetical protein